MILLKVTEDATILDLSLKWLTSFSQLPHGPGTWQKQTHRLFSMSSDSIQTQFIIELMDTIWEISLQMF